MNKKLIALAVAAGLASPMAANAAPTLYGHLQAEIANVDNEGYGENNGSNGVGRTEVADGESGLKMKDNKRGRLGVKGSEDLGGGLSALYNFEWQVNTTTGGLTDGQRVGMVGLKGDFGTFEAGRIKAAYKYSGGVKYDPFVTTYMEARRSGGMSGGAFGHNSFWNNSIAYKNNFGNMSLWINYGVDEGDAGPDAAGDDATSAGNSGDISAALKYNSGNIEAYVAMATDDKTSSGDPATYTGESYDAVKVGGQWKAGPHAISGQYEMTDSGGANGEADIMFLGYQMKMGKNAFVAQLGQTDHDVDDNDVDYMAVGMIHHFSKKTRAFVGYRNSDQDNGDEISAVSTGLRVTF
ncbi:porin [Thiohalophilus thiocyanatoxydans]|uniref:Putative porin n=1 Tax=Thiohalophilus thiocyanatoxydans TaxID=381308 RepID=A0A4R8IV06_9GAMM|nr:porin [Thiohalophilus thiocyanatoxydans]TDY04274.1 putative porin [Thiohalophilus thiocyanatoxydans]